MVFIFLTSLSMIIFSCIHVATNGIISFVSMAENCSIVCVCVCVCTHHIFFIHSSVNGHLGYFHVFAVVNSAINTGVYVSFWITVLSGYMPRSGIAGPHDSCIFSFIRNLYNVFHSALSTCIPTNGVGGFSFLHILSRISFADFLVMVILTIVRCTSLYFLTYISLTTSHVEHLFICLLAICISCLEKCVFRSFAYFSGFFFLLLLSCTSCLYILEINPLLVGSFVDIFSHSVGGF